MVQACRYALAGQVGAFLALVATEVLPSGASLADLALRFACGCEAIGYGLGAVAAMRGLGLVAGPGQRVVRGVFSAVLWGLCVRHAVLFTDPMAVADTLVQGSTWGLGGASWVVALVVSARRGPAGDGSLRQQLGWLAGVAVFGALNTLAMAAVRALT